MSATPLPAKSKSVTVSLDVAVSVDDSQMLVLLVDDDARFLALCERYLLRAQSNTTTVKVHTARTLREALDLYQKNNYDCLVVDYLLPDGTGTQLITTMSRDVSSPFPPAIITTSDGGEDAATDAIRAGAVDYLSKRNLNSRSLSRSINNAVDKFRLSESLKLKNSELREANRRLQRNRTEIMNFYHTVSHEVKTPLAAAREFISLLIDGVEGEITPNQQMLLQMAIESCDQIKNQFSELLDMTRLETGKIVLSRQSVAVSRLAARSVSSVAEISRMRNVKVEVEMPDNAVVLADADRIIQVIANLLHNAVKFSHVGGSVILEVQLCGEGSALEFRVSDNGCGIAEEEQLSVFDRLYQSHHQKPEASENGLGLGLAIAKEIIELHGSQLGVTSLLNSGSTFYFRLPCSDTSEYSPEL